MTFFTNAPRGCMRFIPVKVVKSQSNTDPSRSCEKTAKTSFSKLTRKQITELFFESCVGCEKMSAIPQGAFAARKVREAQEEQRNWLISRIDRKEKSGEGKGNQYNTKPTKQGMELTPVKYNSKLMNSIWGLYNRYSVHNFKKNTNASEGVLAATCGAVVPTA